MPEQPNILFILSDQHSPHVLGCAGDPLVRTPTLDRLAAQGIRFTRNYCPSPLCVPSRMAMLAAQHCSEIQVWTNACTLSSEVPTFPHALGAAGYETLLCGRMHFIGRDQRHGYHRRLVGDVDPSFDHVPRTTTGQKKEGVVVAGPGRTVYTAYDDAVTRACCEFLRGRGQAPARPFFLTAGYVLPHCPYICPKRLFDEYYPQVDVPRLPPDYLERLHPAMRAWRERRGVDHLTDEQVRVARAAYYGLVTYMDERIGEVLATLEETGLARDTLVVYASDHGDMAGEHRMWWKSSFYEGSAGVPLIFSCPGRLPEGRRVDRVTSLVDLGPTILDLVGAAPLPTASGRSFAGFLREPGDVPNWPDIAFAEYCGLLGDAPALMVRRGPWKLNVYHDYDQPQLFNLDEDPSELDDRAGDPACATVRSELMAMARSHWSGGAVEAALRRKAAVQALIRRWRGALPDPSAAEHATEERWTAPPGCNIFPEE